MRVRQRLGEERGAVAATVAIALIVLVGMVALTLDLGRAVAVRRGMVTASDSAALAAAQQCAIGNGEDAARSAADATAVENDGVAVRVSIEGVDSECSTGQIVSGAPKLVTVTYTRKVDYFVAPILGFDDVTVTTTASALWGVARKASAIPLRVNLVSLIACDIDFNTEEQKTCYLTFDNGANAGAANDWSWLFFGGADGTGWNTTDCSNQGSGTNDPGYFLDGGEFTNPSAGLLNESPPTYVCSYSGNAQSVIGDLVEREGDILTFPVVDAVNYPVIGSGANRAWPVVAFSSLRLVDVYTQQESFPPECPPATGPDNSKFCIQLRWEGPTPGGSVPGFGMYAGVKAIGLVK